MIVTAFDIVSSINQLQRNRVYQYINPKNKGSIEIIRVQLPEGPITIRRYDTSKGETSSQAKDETISTQMIWRVANAFRENQPINFDRVLGGSYNTRSVLEALIVNSPLFYYCYPHRIENINSTTEIKKGHKHVIWCPENPHSLGVMQEIQTEIIISEVPSIELVYDALVLNDDLTVPSLDIDVRRRHAQIQIALVEIGTQLNFRTWVAQNDRGITYRNRPISEMEGVVVSLRDERLVTAYEEAIQAASFIDCIWFKNGRLMPAVMEIEHTTGVTSGLTRMKKFYDAFPPFPTRYVIVAPDEDKQKVIDEANKDMFRAMNSTFFPIFCSGRVICPVSKKEA